MTNVPEPWAKQWLAEKRASDPEGVRGWTLEKKGETHYVKWGTTVWDKEKKKYRKKSRYIGKLNPNGTLVEPKRREKGSVTISAPVPLGVRNYGAAFVIKEASERFVKPLSEHFPDMWKELLAMAELRLLGAPRMNHASDTWRLVDDIRGLDPRLSPEVLSDVLGKVGGNSGAQERFFEAIDDGEDHVAVDLSVVFSKSEGMRMLRKGYNRFKLRTTQFNLAAICGLKSGRPTRLCMVCGNVKENSVVKMVERFGIPSPAVLVMDRGYGGKNILGSLHKGGYDFIVALRRDSDAYKTVPVGSGHFLWEGRAINYGKGEFWGYHAYRFEDLELRAKEIGDKYKAEAEKGRELKDMDRAGHIMILSSMNLDPYQIYRMFKMRCSVENFFDTMKNDLSGDATYLSDDLKVMGYNFVTFLAYCIWWEIRSRLESADLCSRFSPEDVIRKFSAVNVFYTDRGPFIGDVPKDVRTLAEGMGLTVPSAYIPQKS